jgi:hypothetical protein
MNYIYTKTEHYKIFYEKNKTDRLSKNLKILPESDKINLFKISFGYKNNEEIFNESIETEYSIEKLKRNFFKITFRTNSNTKYRLDIHVINEINGIVNHISFTEYDSKYDIIPDDSINFDEYEESYNKPTNRNEMIELVNRVHFILKDIINNNYITDNLFCIGGTEIESKNNIYEYSLKVIVGKDGFDKLKTNVYPETGWGLYFSI